jgi:hypothetical protein
MNQIISKLMEGADLSTCSEEVRKGITWLENNVAYDEEKVRTELSNKEKAKFGEIIEIPRLKRKLEIKYDADDALAFYVLQLFGSKLFMEYFEASKNDAFWQNPSSFFPTDNYTDILWFQLKMHKSQEHSVFLRKIKQLKHEIDLEGRFNNSNNHLALFRFLVLLDPYSEEVKQVLKYMLDVDWIKAGVFETSIGVLALSELDLNKYENEINDCINYIKGFQNDVGSYKSYYEIKDTSYAIQAISKINGASDDSVKSAVNWIKSQQNKDGSWGYISSDDKNEEIFIPDIDNTAYALLSLISVGEGIKIPVYKVEQELDNLIFDYEKARPQFVHTSPIFKEKLHVKDIRNKLFEMLHSAEKEIRICSLFIDMLYEELIGIKNEKPYIDIKIITRPSKEIDGLREKIARNVLELLKISTKGNLKQFELIHSRMIIIDEKELLVSSADMTYIGLIDEFNAGIWTKDHDTIIKAIEFFDNIWKQLETKK